MPKSITSYIPNTITLLNLASGCVAIYMAFNLDTYFGGYNGGTWCLIAIAAAALFDFLDGFFARLLKAFSPLGGDLDSLSDLVSFGVAPGMLMLNTMAAGGTPLLLCFAALLIPACGALRLAKFNVDTEQTTYFKGLPIPANAIFWIGVYGWIQTYYYPGWLVLLPLIVLVSLSMTANFKMFSLKFKNLDFAENFCRYVILVAAVVFTAFYGLSGLIWTILLYFLLSFLKRNSI